MLMTPTSQISFLMLAITAVLAGCSTLPRDGPTSRAVERGGSAPEGIRNYTIVELNYEISERIKVLPPQFLGSLTLGASQGAGGAIGVGDVLAVSIFEPSGALFGGGSSSSGVRAGSQGLPPLTVDGNGSIAIPYAGSVQVAGMTPTQAAASIRRSLIGKVGNPQVVVSLAQNAFNTVIVLGDVRNPGRAPLSVNADRILDVIAAAGGPTRPPEDVLVSIQRNGETFSAPMTAVTSEFGENIRLARGDQVNLLYRPRRFSTFGALGAVSQTDIPPGSLSLAGALSRVGGLDTNTANARSVLVFRFERPEVAEALGVTQPASIRGVPIVYRLNLEEPSGFFTANNFQIQPEDIVYVPRSGSAELSKFFTLVQTVTRVVYDVSVTSTLTNN